MTENETPQAGPEPGPSAGPAVASPPAPRPPLRRSRTDRKMAGVCGGLGRYTGIDPLVFRVVAVVLAVFGGSGLLLYALGWLLIPEEGENESEAQRLVNGRGSTGVVGAILLAFVGVAAFGQLVGTGFGFGGIVALAAIGVAALLISRSNHSAGAGVGAGAGQQGPSPNPPPTGAGPGAYGQTQGTAYTSGPQAAPVSQAVGGYPPPAGSAGYPPPGTPYGPPPPPPPPAPPKPPKPPKPPRERSPLGRIAVSVALLVAGVLVGIDAATSQGVEAQIVLAASLTVIGLGLVVSAFVGRARGLIAIGAALVLATTVVGAADAPFRGGAGDRRWEPATVATVDSPYRLGAGNARLDLGSLAVPAGDTLHVEASVGVGELIVRVPADAALDIDAHSGIGNVEMPDGNGPEGIDSTRHYVAPGSGTAGLIKLDLKVGVGNLEVLREAS